MRETEENEISETEKQKTDQASDSEAAAKIRKPYHGVRIEEVQIPEGMLFDLLTGTLEDCLSGVCVSAAAKDQEERQ